MPGEMTNLILGFLLLVLIFFVCREVMCWYWKVNEAISLLREIRDKLDKKSV